jgi:hypothetical protein
MATIYLALRISALLITLILPLARPRVKENKNHIRISDWAVNEKGVLINTAEKEGQHTINIKH